MCCVLQTWYDVPANSCDKWVHNLENVKAVKMCKSDWEKRKKSKVTFYKKKTETSKYEEITNSSLQPVH